FAHSELGSYREWHAKRKRDDPACRKRCREVRDASEPSCGGYPVLNGIEDNKKKPVASLSLDLDNKWSYMKTHGDPGWTSFPSYLDIVVPRVLDFLKSRNQKISFFIVGQDAALAKNLEALSKISAAGHEIGNHSFHHEPWLHLYSVGQIESELASAEKHIERATGQRPVGFRGPGFSLSR